MKPLLLLFGLLASTALAADVVIPLPAPVGELVQNDTVFESFGRTLAEKVDRLLDENANPADGKLLRSLRLHLAIGLGNHEAALATTELIREALPENADKLYSGLTTKASIAAQKITHALPGNAKFNAVFLQDFAHRLTALPISPAVTAMLIDQKGRATKMTDVSMQAEIAALSQLFAGRAQCSLAEADQIVRLRHRYRDLLPLRSQIIEALDQAIAARTPATK